MAPEEARVYLCYAGLKQASADFYHKTKFRQYLLAFLTKNL